MTDDKLVVEHLNIGEVDTFHNNMVALALGTIGPPNTIQIKYFVDFPEPWRIKYSENSDWIDLRAATHLSLKNGEYATIPLGIAVKLPHNYEAHVVPRSSTYKNFGIIQTNHMGVIDNSYCGPNDQWLMAVLAMRDTQINFGDRICQFRIVERMPRIPIIEVKELIGEDRGGHGSTGIK